MKYFLLLLPLLFNSTACKKKSHSPPIPNYLGNPLIADPAIQTELKLASTKLEVVNLIGHPLSIKSWLNIRDGIWDFYDEWTCTDTNLQIKDISINPACFVHWIKQTINKFETP